MIASTRSASHVGGGWPGLPRTAPRRWSFTVTFAPEGRGAGRPADAPAPRRVDAELEALLTDGAAFCPPDRARSAARAFGAGNGFLPGQIIDRAI